MPAAVLIAGLVAIALAFAAIAASLLIRQLVEQPIKSASIAVAEVALVGGVLSWTLSHLVTLIEIALAPVEALTQTAENQASAWWNALVYGTVNTLYHDLLNTLIWVWANFGAISYIVSHFPGLEAYLDRTVGPTATAAANDLAGLHHWIDNFELPFIRGIGDDLAGLHAWINNVELPIIRGIGDDLAGLHRWIDVNLVNRGELAQAEARAAAAAAAAAAPAIAAVQAIENSPCMKFCAPLGDLGQLLQGLEDAGMLAIMVAVVEEAMHDPVALEREIASDIVPPIKSALSGLSLGIPG